MNATAILRGGSELVREQTYYLPTYLIDDKGSDATGEVSLFTRRFRLRRTRKGLLKLGVWVNVESYPDDDAMLAAIEERGLRELPADAETDLLYLPAEFDVGVKPEREFSP